MDRPLKPPPGRPASHIIGGFLVCAALTALSVAWIDRPLASFLHTQTLAQPATIHGALLAMTRIPEWLGVLAVLLAAALGLLRLRRGPLSGYAQAGFLAALSVIVADVIKTALKLTFGRTWPETWIDHNPSFIQDGAYCFSPFHGGPGWGSFPSGHMTAVCAAMTVLWFLWPRARLLYALAVAATAAGLLGLNYHFLSDILAGAYLGWAVGLATLTIGSSAAERACIPHDIPV
jgi:membrane-associated phospholipid phosphatase